MPRRPPLDDAILLTALLAVLGATAALAGGRGTALTLAHALPRSRPSTEPVLDAYVVLQRADCETHLHALSLFRRAPVARRVRVGGLILIGSAADLADVRRRHGATLGSLPIHLATADAITILRRLGHSATPFLVVANQARDVKLTVQLPSSPEEFVALGKLLPTLESSTASAARLDP